MVAREFVVILLLAGIVLGPERIRDVARWLGKTTAQLRAVSRGFMQQLSAELDAVDEEVGRASSTDLRRETLVGFDLVLVLFVVQRGANLRHVQTGLLRVTLQVGAPEGLLVLEENVQRQSVTTDIATNGGQLVIITIDAYEAPI